MKLYSRKVSDRLTYEYHLVFPGWAFFGLLTIMLMLAVILESIHINPYTIKYAIGIQFTLTIFLIRGIVQRKINWSDDDE